MIKHCDVEKVGVELNVVQLLNKMNCVNVVRKTKCRQGLTLWSSEYKDFVIMTWRWPGWGFQIQQWVAFFIGTQKSEELPNEVSSSPVLAICLSSACYNHLYGTLSKAEIVLCFIKASHEIGFMFYHFLKISKRPSQRILWIWKIYR